MTESMNWKGITLFEESAVLVVQFSKRGYDWIN